MKFDTWAFFENLSEKFKFRYNLTIVTSTLHADQYTFYIITRSFLRMRSVSDRSCREDQHTHFVRGDKRPTRCNRLVFYCKTYCSLNMFRAPLCPSSGAQELYRWLLPVLLGALVYRSLVWCGAVGYVSGLRDARSSTPDQRPVNQSAKCHMQQSSV